MAALSLILALVATGVVIGTASQPSAADPLDTGTAPAWTATMALSDALRALRPGDERAPASDRARAAAQAVAGATARVEALSVPTADTPLRNRVLSTLRADAEWIDAVGSTLANPRSRRRAELPDLAEKAATETAVVAMTFPEAKGSVGGTGRLLAATRPD